MSRHVQEKLTDEEIISRYKPKVFGIYARNFLRNIASKNNEDPTKISTHHIHNNGTTVKRIVRLLHENEVIFGNWRGETNINLELFDREAPALAHLNQSEFQLDTASVFLESMADKPSVSKETIALTGGKPVQELSTSTALWAFFNQDKIYFSKIDKNDYPTLYLKNRETEITRHKLLKILFEELRFHPTEYLAEFCGTAWVGHVSNMPWVRNHHAKDIVRNPLQLAKAEREIRNYASHFLAYANMLKEIKIKMKGDTTERITSFLKFMVEAMFRKAPLNLQSISYKTILENAHAFYFDNMFPGGLTKEQINGVRNRMSKS